MAESFRNPRDAIASRPEPETLLRIAIRERDGLTAARLVQQWVHRRGLPDLQRFQQELILGEDPEAAFWLRRQWDDPLADPPTAASSAPAMPSPAAPVAAAGVPTTVAPATLATVEAAAPDPVPDPGSLCGTAIAEAKSVETDPHALPGESFTEPLSEELRILLATPLEDPFGEPAPSRVRDRAAAMSPLPGATLQPFHSTPLAESAEADEASLAPAVQDSPRGRRGTLSRMKARMRGYFEDAMEVLHRVALPAGLEEEGDESPPAAPGPADPSSPSDSPDLGGPAVRFPPGLEKSAPAAPPPTTLADLRSWLPDAAGDLPRAS